MTVSISPSWSSVINMRLPANTESSTLNDSFLTPALLSLQRTLWKYRGEGNANLVLCIPNQNSIIRIRKCAPNEADDPVKIWREVDFGKNIMVPLLGARFVHVPKMVKFSKWELAVLTNELIHFRPQKRQNGAVFSEYGAVFPDLCFLPDTSQGVTYCVEIKPKQGWIPISDRRLPKCTFCLNQYLKMKDGAARKFTSYCPLDLFSGDIYRMKHAIRCLLSCPQNNFKIFRNGSLQFGENHDSHQPILQNWFGNNVPNDELVENLCSILVQALTCDFRDDGFDFHPPLPTWHENRQTRVSNKLLEKARKYLNGESCFKKSYSLPQGCILNKILKLQKLDVVGSDEVHRKFSSMNEDDFDYVETLLEDQSRIFDPIMSYLIATTAKDCSILLAFRRRIDSSRVNDTVRDLSGNLYDFSIGVSDLDPKPLSCIEKHRIRDIKVVKSCVSWFENNAM